MEVRRFKKKRLNDEDLDVSGDQHRVRNAREGPALKRGFLKRFS
jgi:hypothetical protein